MKAKSLAVLLLVGSAMANTQRSVIHLKLVEAEAPSRDAEKASFEKNQEDQNNKNQLTYATNGKPIPGPANEKPDKANEPATVEDPPAEVDGKAKPKKKLSKEEKKEEEEEKEHPEKMCESLKKPEKGEEETKQEKVNEPAPPFEKPKDPPRKKKPPKKKAAAADGAAKAADPAAKKAVETPAKPAPVATVKADAKKEVPNKKVNLMTHEDPAEEAKEAAAKLDEETGNVKEVNKVTGKPDNVPAFTAEEKQEQ